MAEEAEVDLVEIAPMAQPPVCKMMDFGKFKYQEAKRPHEAKLKQKQVQVKEVKFRPGTDENDYQIKLRNLIKFLQEGDKAKITLAFPGPRNGPPGVRHAHAGADQGRSDGSGAWSSSFPKMEGRQLIMVLAPTKKQVKH